MSVAGGRHGIEMYNDVRTQAEKLAAIYMIQDGLSASKAAEKATDGLINFKYVYQDGYRIPGPKDSNPVLEDYRDIAAGAWIARAGIGENVHGIDLRVRPFMDTFAAYTPEQLQSETAEARRTGHWATASGETGLWYVYSGQVLKKPDGTPLKLTWKQLADIAKAENQQRYSQTGGAAEQIGYVPIPQGQPTVEPGAFLSGRRAGPTPAEAQARIDELNGQIDFLQRAATDPSLSPDARAIAQREHDEAIAALAAAHPATTPEEHFAAVRGKLQQFEDARLRQERRAQEARARRTGGTP